MSTLANAIKLRPSNVAPMTSATARAISDTTKAEPPKAEPAKVEPPKAETPKPEAVVPPKPAPEAKAPEAPKAVEPAKATPKAPPKGPGEVSFLEEPSSGTPGWAIGAGALAVLGGIAAIVAARRRKTTKFEDSIISGTDIKTNTVFGSTGGGVVNTGDNSLASDFSREGLGNIDTDEVDPIAEAEVYLAYGRDAQAEEILKDALKKDPQRQEIYLKLLEIHAQHNKPSAFETVASELYAVSQGQGEVWHKAVALGRQLDPANPMFAEGGAPAPRAPRPVESDTFAVSSDYKPDTTKADKGFDIGLDEEISLSPTSGATAKPMDVSIVTPATRIRFPSRMPMLVVLPLSLWRSFLGGSAVPHPVATTVRPLCDQWRVRSVAHAQAAVDGDHRAGDVRRLV